MNRTKQIQLSNIDATHSLCTSLSTSLGPRGSDKMLIDEKNKTTITNDGATILKKLQKNHPILHVLSSLSQTQDSQCGDGTTTVVLLAGAMLHSLKNFVANDVSVFIIYEAINEAKLIVKQAINEMKLTINEDFDEKDNSNKNNKEEVNNKTNHIKNSSKNDSTFWKAATTTLNSKVVSTVQEIANTAVAAIKIANGKMEKIKIIKKLGKNLEDVFFQKGAVLKKPAVLPKKNAKMLLVQFCVSPPKTAIDSKVVLNSAEKMENLILEERKYVLEICKKIKLTGADLICVQKSILRKSVSELALHFLTKMGISVVDDLERSEIEFLEDCFEMKSVSDFSLLSEEKVKEVLVECDDEFLRVGGIEDAVTVVLRGGDELLLDEAERSLNDALWVVKALFDEPSVVPGGGTVEAAVAKALRVAAEDSKHSSIFGALADGFERIPFLLAQNSGLDAIEIVGLLRKNGGGVNVRMGCVGDLVVEEIVQPTKVLMCAAELALECVGMILMIDDILPSVK
jgi:T-complex protein 1 subunit delta